MQSDLPRLMQSGGLFSPGDRVVCAVSGGADSMALLWALWLSRQQLSIAVSAAHFNHGLRAGESQRDEAFVRDFCQKWEIPLQIGTGDVKAHAAKSGQSVEQAARQLRYEFLLSLPHDKIATAHTANDNAETVLLNLISGTGLRGLCGIPPVRETVVRPLLSVTREEILSFLAQHHIDHVEDSTNAQDDARRNRVRHDLLPLFLRENPAWLSAVQTMTCQLWQEEETLGRQARLMLNACRCAEGYSCACLRAVPDGLRQRCLRRLLTLHGAARPSHRHVQALDRLISSPTPSGAVVLPGGLRVRREYDLLLFHTPVPAAFDAAFVAVSGVTRLASVGLQILCRPADRCINSTDTFTVVPRGQIVARPRQAGDVLHLSGGTKSLKKLMIDCKIPRLLRDRLPVLADEAGILAVYRLGPDLRRIGLDGAVNITIQKLEDDAL